MIIDHVNSKKVRLVVLKLEFKHERVPVNIRDPNLTLSTEMLLTSN